MVYVLSDVHGNLTRFRSVLRQIKLQDSDTLYVLGDVIDRNPDGLKILRFIMKTPNVRMLLGNHEQMMLRVLENPEDMAAYERWVGRNGGDVTLAKWRRYRKTHRAEMVEFLKSLPLNIPVSAGGREFLLVHGSPIEGYRGEEKFRDAEEYAVWNRIDDGTPLPEDRTVVFGHTPTKYYDCPAPYRMLTIRGHLAIDCGCAYPDGRLCCLRLDDMREFYSNE